MEEIGGKVNKTQFSKIFKISRSSLYWKPSSNVRKRYKKKEDVLVLKQIQEVLKERPTYGVARITAMINRNRLSEKRLLDFPRLCGQSISSLTFSQMEVNRSYGNNKRKKVLGRV